MADFKSLQKLYQELEFEAADRSNSTIKGSGGGTQASMLNTQRIAGYALAVIDDRVNFLLEFAELKISEIKKVVEKPIVYDHQCYSDKDNKCVTCGREL